MELWNAAVRSDVIDLAAFEAAAPMARSRIGRFCADRWDRLPGRPQRYLAAAALLGPGSVGTAEVADRLGGSQRSLSMDRDRLISEGLLHAPRRGEVAFVIPPMAEWIRGDLRTDVQAFPPPNDTS